MVTCAKAGKASACVLHHAKPVDYIKRHSTPQTRHSKRTDQSNTGSAPLIVRYTCAHLSNPPSAINLLSYNTAEQRHDSSTLLRQTPDRQANSQQQNTPIKTTAPEGLKMHPTTSHPAPQPASWMRVKWRLLSLLALGFAVLLTTPAAYSNEDSSKKSSKAQKRQNSRVIIQNTRSSSEETPAQRDKRLYRECQGLPNSGACAGYTKRR